MADLNRVSLIGRLTRDSELKYISSGGVVCNFAVALNRRKKSGDTWVEETNYFDIVLWGKSAENLHKYLVKGKQVAIDGELRQDRWEQDGQMRSRVIIVATNLQLLGGGDRSSYQGGSNASQQTTAYRQREQSTQSFPEPDYNNPDLDSVPF